MPLLLALAMAVSLGPARARPLTDLAPPPQAQAEASAQTAAASLTTDAAPAPRNIKAYTLPPDLYRKAKDLARIRLRDDLLDFFYALAVLWLILEAKLAPRFRDWAERATRRRFLQALIFAPLLALTFLLAELPLELYEHGVSRAYGLSVEGWGAFLLDWSKGLLLLMAVGSFLAWILYGGIRRSPRRWWLYFWLISLPLIVFLSFIEPFVIEPMFFQFAPLSQKDPALVAQIERVVARAGPVIPPDRMFWMRASEKTPTMNAYVTGIGASKRVVVWDTNIAHETTDEILSDFGHEMGHYVLGHIWKGLIFEAAVLFALFYLGYRTVGSVLARWGARWKIRGLDDWASLPALLLLLTIFNFASDPISNAFSRHIEHQADVYGLEVTHGVMPDAGQAAADSFQVEGESSLSDPDPSPLNVFLFYDHPPIADRVSLCLTYDPWAHGEPPQFVK